MIASLLLSFIIAICGGIAGIWIYSRIVRDLPDFLTIADYRPPIVTEVYSSDGTLIAEFFRERRYLIKINEVPEIVKKTFLAAEDRNFYTHPGVDLKSILRAAIKNFRSGSAKQGASTITQQVVKNILLTPEKSLERKAKEALLAYKLEKNLSKDEIFEIYLNQIYFGNSAYGLRAATKIYFHKEPSEITLAEAALLAGLPKAPSRFSPIENMKAAKARRNYVLRSMLEANFINEQEFAAANVEEIKVFRHTPKNIYSAPYFVTEVRRLLSEDSRWKDIDIDSAGLKIHTTLDLKANDFATTALKSGLREVDKRRGYRGNIDYIEGAKREMFLKKYPASNKEIKPNELYPALITEIADPKAGIVKIDLGFEVSALNLKKINWAKKKLDKFDNVSWVSGVDQILKPGDVIEVSLIGEEVQNKQADSKKDLSPTEILPGIKSKFQLDQTPEIEGALVLLDPYSGNVLAMVGGYDYARSQFNRVTQSLRQPGSSFKPIVYLAAIDEFGYTPTTIVEDAPRVFKVGDNFWSPNNFDQTFLGNITLRTALEKSRNIISAQIVSRIGTEAIIRYARKLGITSKLGDNLSISLGSSEVTPLELTRAYGVFAAKGALVDTSLISKIIDRAGSTIFDSENEKFKRVKQVLSEATAFVMANLMRGVVENGTGYKVRELKRPVAGKTGTSNQLMDAWFVGYTPQYVAGVWVGFDEKKKIGEKETGGMVAAPIWRNFMRDFLNYEDNERYQELIRSAKEDSEKLGIHYRQPARPEPIDFAVPDGVEAFWVNRQSGALAAPGSSNVYIEYFLKGSAPSASYDLGGGISEEEFAESETSYLNAPDL